MSVIASLLWKELFSKPRERLFHLKRIVFVALGGVVVLAVYVRQLIVQGDKAGLVMFEFLSVLVVITACLVAPFMACSAIVSEKESRTLCLLLMSEVSMWQLMVSKLLASILTTFFTIISTLPLFALCESLGGISFGQVAASFPVLLCTVISGTCLGLFMSAFLEKELRMHGAVIFAAVVFYVVLPAMIAFGSLLLSGWPMVKRTLVVVSPIYAMDAIRSARNFDLIGWNCLFSVLIGLPLVPLSVYLLPRLYIRPEGSGVGVHSLRERVLGRFSKQGMQRPPISGNPMVWKDLYVHYGGENSNWLRCLAGCLGMSAFMCLAYLLLAVAPSSPVRFDRSNAFELMLLGVCILSGVSYLYGAVSRAATCCQREKESGSLELLLTTDISGYSILMGKSNAISLTLLPWITMFLLGSVSLVVTRVASGVGDPKNFTIITAAVVLNLFCMVFAFEYLAMYLSLKLETFDTATALAGFVAWYVVGNLLFGLAAAILAPFTVMLSVLVIPIGCPIMIGNHIRVKLIREFQSLATDGT